MPMKMVPLRTIETAKSRSKVETFILLALKAFFAMRAKMPASILKTM